MAVVFTHWLQSFCLSFKFLEEFSFPVIVFFVVLSYWTAQSHQTYKCLYSQWHFTIWWGLYENSVENTGLTGSQKPLVVILMWDLRIKLDHWPIKNNWKWSWSILQRFYQLVKLFLAFDGRSDGGIIYFLFFEEVGRISATDIFYKNTSDSVSEIFVIICF